LKLRLKSKKWESNITRYSCLSRARKLRKSWNCSFKVRDFCTKRL